MLSPLERSFAFHVNNATAAMPEEVFQIFSCSTDEYNEHLLMVCARQQCFFISVVDFFSNY
jgi:hypothetical protein